MFSTVLFALALLFISNAVAFNVMKTPRMVAKKPLSMALESIPVESMISGEIFHCPLSLYEYPKLSCYSDYIAKTELMAQGMLIAADPGVPETFFGFIFVAVCIMGSLPGFLEAFEKK